MGSISYDFLNHSLLFDSSLIDENFSSIPEKTLFKELLNYREFIISQIDSLHAEIHDKSQLLRVFGAKDYFSIDQLIQTAFYLDQVVIPDPLFPFSYTKSQPAKVMNEYLGLKNDDSINRKYLTQAAKKMKQASPMVAANYVKFFPVSYFFERDGKIPITYSESAYSDVLPLNILNIYREKAKVSTVTNRKGALIVEDKLEIGRQIGINFHGDDAHNMLIYKLFDHEAVEFDPKTRLIKVAMSLSSEPPTRDQFEHWVSESVNRSAIAHHNNLQFELHLSTKLGVSYLTGSPFSHALLGSSIEKKSIQHHTTEQVLNMDLPFLQNVSIENLMKIRQNDGEAFDVFRKTLESKFKLFRFSQDADFIKKGIEDAMHELAEEQIAKINLKVKELRRGVLANTAIALGGLAGSVVTGGFSLAATLIAVANGYKDYSEYREKVTDNPSYFLWKVKK